MTDPAEFVDKFTEQVKHWREARPIWERHIIEGYGTSDGKRNWDARASTKELFDALDDLFKTQQNINVMMLAALDELKSQLEAQQ